MIETLIFIIGVGCIVGLLLYLAGFIIHDGQILQAVRAVALVIFVIWLLYLLMGLMGAGPHLRPC